MSRLPESRTRAAVDATFLRPVLRAPYPCSRRRPASATPPAARQNDSAALTGAARAAGRRSGEARNPTDRPSGETGGGPRLAVGAIARGPGDEAGRPRPPMGRQRERREEPAHGVGLGHHAQDPPCPTTAAERIACRSVRALLTPTPSTGSTPDSPGSASRFGREDADGGEDLGGQAVELGRAPA